MDILGAFGECSLMVALCKRSCAGIELGLGLILALCTKPYAVAQAPSHFPSTDAKPAVSHPLTAEQDRERLLGLLGLKESDLRPAPVPDAKSPKAANYDEAKANVYPQLPDPLIFKNGQPVKTPIDW